MKKVISIAALALILFSLISVNADENVKVYVNGNEVITDTSAIIMNDSTMLPFRAILNALGVDDSKIIWDEATQSIEVKTDGRYIFLAVANDAAISNDNVIMLTTPPYIKDGRTMVPVRFISEGLGAKVEWNESDRSVLITR